MMIKITNEYEKDSDAIIHYGSCYDFVKKIPSKSVKLVVTSPPYNIGKEYEKKVDLNNYYKSQEKIIDDSVRILTDDGSICWQIGNYVENSEIIPLDILLFPIFQKNQLKLRNRIIWHFGHGLHASKRFSGRYETILWFTKSDHYTFNLDPVRVPQKYPNKKHFKGPNKGKLSCNPLGKNPSDVWEIPNVKNNHIEKTVHPCQFPVELIERLVLSMTNPKDFVFDPFMGVGSTAVAAIKNNRRTIGCEIMEEYYEIAMNRITLSSKGTLKTRPMHKPVYNPNKDNTENKIENNKSQSVLFKDTVNGVRNGNQTKIFSS
ncbi:MAG: adenine-specific DNA-methyltransferase [Thermotogaceae bacterium]|nr:adenine-specific DNA-methyltransferase [Thermotogaceae bacterium]